MGCNNICDGDVFSKKLVISVTESLVHGVIPLLMIRWRFALMRLLLVGGIVYLFDHNRLAESYIEHS